MSNSNNNNSRVPKLRFPGFTGEWEEKMLGEIASKVNRRNRNLGVSRVLTNSATEGVIDQSDYFDRDIAVKGNTDNYHIVELNDFVYNPRISSAAPVGPISINKVGKGIMSPLYTIFKFHGGHVPFFEHYFSTNIWHPYLKSIANFGARFDRMNITSEGFFNMPLYVPDPLEQQKIAECLTEMDNLISAQAQKVELLKTHKKGLMQQLFPQPGETTPQLRFPGFTGEWEEKKLGEVAIFYKGKGISKNDVSYKGGTPCVRYGELYTYYSEIIKETKSFTDIPSNDLFLSRANDVIIPSSGETKEDISTASCVLIDNIALGGDINVIRSSINGVFLSYYLSNAKKNDIARMAQGISVIHLYNEQLKTLQIVIPTLPEQLKIAECLSELDKNIEAESAKLEALKIHKKGLMQQLFPEPIK